MAGEKKESVLRTITKSQLTWSVVAIIALIVLNRVVDPNFLALRWNDSTVGLAGPLITVISESARYLLIACGMTLVVSTGGIDLSVGSVMAVAGAASMQLLVDGANVWVALGVALLLGIVLGAVNGFLVSVVRLQAFITTLIMMMAGRGLAKVITGGQNADASNIVGTDFLVWMGSGSIFGLPANFVIAVVIVIAVALLVRKTALGMMIESVGINAEASRMAGINPRQILFIVHVLCGLLAAVAGVFVTSSVMRVDVTGTGQDLEMYAILSVVIGGTSLLGGKFSLAGSALGAIIIALIRKTIITLGINSAATPAFFAVVVIVICVMQAPKVHNFLADRKRKKALEASRKVVE